MSGINADALAFDRASDGIPIRLSGRIAARHLAHALVLYDQRPGNPYMRHASRRKTTRICYTTPLSDCRAGVPRSFASYSTECGAKIAARAILADNRIGIHPEQRSNRAPQRNALIGPPSSKFALR